MFGYIIADRQQMSDEDTDRYKGYYCGLCKELTRIAGLKGSVILSYDVTFLYVLLSGLYEPENTITIEKCSVHPFKKHTVITNELVEYAAAMNILLGYFNLLDDYVDEHNRRKKQLADYLSKYIDDIAKRYPRQYEACVHNIDCIGRAEKSHEENIDIPAGKTGQMLAEIFAMKEDEWAGDLKNMGYYIGKFVYILDAYMDIEKDRKSGNYNPLIVKKDGNPQCFEDYISMSLTSMMSETAKSFEILPIIQDESILRNVLYSGVWSALRNHRYRKQKDSEADDEQASVRTS